MKKISEFFLEYGYDITSEQEKQLYTYYEYLIQQNEFINLTGITEYEEVIIKHFIDSLSILRIEKNLEGKKIVDVGTGAGFPGMVLAIMFPKAKITLIDSLNKRILFLQRLTKMLNLTNVESIHIRSEDFAKENSIKFDIVVSRAVAYMDKLLAYCVPLMNKNGKFIAYKGKFDDEEEKVAKKVLKKYNCKILKKEVFNLTDNENVRTLIEIVRNDIL